ncbi:hypothetical protein LSH36_1139g00051 [Paralvinella palmiformis]|uniref:Calponin-homology (CH) domain-containing protein n=1 Tax=Paralvinella palmiformis TaxID=53620 RepID=A0AAD9MPI2_9ANNE|nr:hypothetical protein LSH36_1139g00051 [Paralvinella palmiformis]
MAKSAGKEDWRLCVDWLARCQLLPKSHILLNQDATVIHLGYFLRDGVQLCNLLNNISPGVIPFSNFSQNPKASEFLCLRNIHAFLDACLRFFYLKNRDLFAVGDLFYLTDFGKVCIS